MYAIRSYYDPRAPLFLGAARRGARLPAEDGCIASGGDRPGPRKGTQNEGCPCGGESASGSVFVSGRRITSYNVCYTKLLRIISSTGRNSGRRTVRRGAVIPAAGFPGIFPTMTRKEKKVRRAAIFLAMVAPFLPEYRAARKRRMSATDTDAHEREPSRGENPSPVSDRNWRNSDTSYNFV